MQFDLTQALIDQIMFSMEDQEQEHRLDTVESVVLSGDEISEDSDRYILIPEWESADGFRLMEKFAAGLRNPVVREELSSALDRGKGVFRAFKDVLNSRPEVERLWFSYKEKEMRRHVLDWYNALREEWGLEKLGAEPEETGDLVLEDFRFRTAVPEDREKAEKLRQLCRQEFLADSSGIDSIQIPEAVLKEYAEQWEFPGTVCIIAETGRGDFAGYLNVIKENNTLKIHALEIYPEFRGLGIGETLLQRFLDQVNEDDITAILINLPSTAEGFSRVLLRSGFYPYETRYSLLPKNTD